jgi:hypothetical protein
MIYRRRPRLAEAAGPSPKSRPDVDPVVAPGAALAMVTLGLALGLLATRFC